MTELAPVAETRRIRSLDVMRGLAVLGILAVNAPLFALPWQVSANPLLPPQPIGEDAFWSWFVMHVFFEFKFITLFSLLFGASIWLVGGERSDKERGAILNRRLVWLLVIGLIHATLIWYGDILVTYAITGFLVMTARSLRPLTLLVAGSLIYLFAFALQHMLAPFMELMPAAKLAMVERSLADVLVVTPEQAARMQAAYQGGLLSAMSENFNTWLMFIQGGLIGLVLRSAGVMMIGMALFKWGFMSGNAAKWLFGLMIALGLIALAIIAWQAWLNWQARFELLHMATRGTAANTLLSIFVSLAYASVCIVLVKVGARFLYEPLAAVGRMAFTNYLTQSLIMTTIFWSGRGFGLWGELDRLTLWAIVLAVWALQLIWSPLWLARFEMGPLEWIWRTLSYRKPVRLAKHAPA